MSESAVINSLHLAQASVILKKKKRKRTLPLRDQFETKGRKEGRKEKGKKQRQKKLPHKQLPNLFILGLRTQLWIFKH